MDVRLGLALDTLPKIQNEGIAPFDFFFIDADKANNPDYFQWALKLSRPGSVIVVDNVVRNGRVVDAAPDEDAQGMRTFMAALAPLVQQKRVSATAIQTVGVKGYDTLDFNMDEPHMKILVASGVDAMTKYLHPTPKHIP